MGNIFFKQMSTVLKKYSELVGYIDNRLTKVSNCWLDVKNDNTLIQKHNPEFSLFFKNLQEIVIDYDMLYKKVDFNCIQHIIKDYKYKTGILDMQIAKKRHTTISIIDYKKNKDIMLIKEDDSMKTKNSNFINIQEVGSIAREKLLKKILSEENIEGFGDENVIQKSMREAMGVGYEEANADGSLLNPEVKSNEVNSNKPHILLAKYFSNLEKSHKLSAAMKSPAKCDGPIKIGVTDPKFSLFNHKKVVIRSGSPSTDLKSPVSGNTNSNCNRTLNNTRISGNLMNKSSSPTSNKAYFKLNKTG